MPELDNSDRAQHGYNAKDSLEQIIKDCLSKSYIKEYEKGYRCGYADYDNSQFFCNFLITFQDDVKWIINITTSLRDRVKMQQWDCYHIKKIVPSIDKSILTYPDDIKIDELDAFEAYRLKIINHVHYSAIDDVVGQRELYEMIQNYATKELSSGKRKDLIGNAFESTIASVLSNRENFEKWVTGDRVKVGVQYSDFEKIVNFFNLNKEEIKGIEATANKDIIGNLESSGMPKTDVIVYVYFKDPNKDIKHFTISCKKTNEKAVSVHQYNADAFADALNPNDSNLRILLNAFQKYGNLRDFGEDNKALLTESLKPYMKKLVRWVLGGFGGKNRTDVQLANYILISDDKDIFIHTIDEYTEELLKPENIVHFGSPFGWTYASGRKGKDIQLKCKIIK